MAVRRPGPRRTHVRQPEERVPHFPQGHCAAGLGVAAGHQIVDVPLTTATLTQLYGLGASAAGRVRVNERQVRLVERVIDQDRRISLHPQDGEPDGCDTSPASGPPGTSSGSWVLARWHIG